MGLFCLDFCMRWRAGRCFSTNDEKISHEHPASYVSASELQHIVLRSTLIYHTHTRRCQTKTMKLSLLLPLLAIASQASAQDDELQCSGELTSSAGDKVAFDCPRNSVCSASGPYLAEAIGGGVTVDPDQITMNGIVVLSCAGKDALDAMVEDVTMEMPEGMYIPEGVQNATEDLVAEMVNAVCTFDCCNSGCVAVEVPTTSGGAVGKATVAFASVAIAVATMMN